MELIAVTNNLHTLEYQINGVTAKLFSLNEDLVSVVTDHRTWQEDVGKLLIFALTFNRRPVVVFCDENGHYVRMVRSQLVQRSIETLEVKLSMYSIDTHGVDLVCQQRQTIRDLYPELTMDTDDLDWLITTPEVSIPSETSEDVLLGTSEDVPTSMPEIQAVELSFYPGYFHVDSGDSKEFLVHLVDETLVAIAFVSQKGYLYLTDEQKDVAMKMGFVVDDNAISGQIKDMFGIH